MKIIAFVCKGNSFKSIICERFAKELTNDFIIVSGGTSPKDKVDEEGALIMKDRGLTMEGYKPHSLEELPKQIDFLVKMGCETECPSITAEKTYDFKMDEYPVDTYEEKRIVVNILEEKIKDLISSIK